MGLRLRDQTDVGTLADVEAGYHLPDEEGLDLRSIIDLGCHAGLTVVDFLCRYPQAEVWGLEVDFDNFCTAVENTWDCDASRAQIYPAALATWFGKCDYIGSASNAYQVVPGDRVLCMTLDWMIENLIGLDSVDFVKFDVEGMEHDVFKAGGRWPEKVQRLKAELHGDYSMAEAMADLQALGFEAMPGLRHPNSVYARRPG